MICLEMGICHGLVNLGGDIRVIGPHPDGTPWRIGIRHPREADALLTSVMLAQGGLASSGDYERCIEIEGRRYSHILNPKTGWPVQGLAAASVIAPHCLVAGSASTIAMLKESAGARWLEELGLPHVWMDAQGRMGGVG
jgi:thiamine biosynthesis lipoprotein